MVILAILQKTALAFSLDVPAYGGDRCDAFLPSKELAFPWLEVLAQRRLKILLEKIDLADRLRNPLKAGQDGVPRE